MTTPLPPLPRRVIVDDADPQIQYSSIDQWTLTTRGNVQNDNGPPFRNATHFTNTTSSLSLQFRGSQPQVFGTGAHYECFVDDTSIGSTFTGSPAFFLTNNVLLCDGAQLFEAKEYTLTLNVTHGDERGFYFDYITYIPSTSDPLGSATVLVDTFDSATSRQGEWNSDPLPSQLNQLDSPTATLVNKVGSFAHANGSSLTFNFTGTSVTWVGFIPGLSFIPGQNQSTSNAIYSIDNAEPVPFSFHTSTQNLTNQVFFTSPTLDPGPHFLEVIHQGNITTPPLVLDHFVVTNNVSTFQVPPATTTSIGKPSTPVPIKAIVGGIIGGIAVLCLAAFLLWRRTHHKRFGTDHDNTATPHLTPFDAPSSGPTVAKAGNRTLKGHRPPMMDPPELNPPTLLNIPPVIDVTDAAPRAENFNQQDPPPRTPPVETVHEDRSARSVADGVSDPPPSYVS